MDAVPAGAARPFTEEVVRELVAAGHTVATGESLTGGLVVAALVDVPGASTVVRGGIVAYQVQLKTALLDVEETLLRAGGPVQAEVAVQLARGARERCASTWGVGTTGVAGPGPADGHPAGTVYIAVDGPGGAVSARLSLSGSRTAVREATVSAALRLLADRLRGR